jgi:dynein heavy chain
MYSLIMHHKKTFQGCYISGIFIEGARWDLGKQCLTSSTTKVLIENLPIVLIVPIETSKLKLLVIILKL